MLKIITDPQDPYIKHIDHDPVRPEIPWSLRCAPPQNWVFVSTDSGEHPCAALCCTLRSLVPTSRDQLFATEYQSSIAVAVFYTVWSYQPRSAGPLIRAARNWIKDSFPHVNKFVTYSPHGQRVRDFHLGNGAQILNVNQDSVNYQYL